MISKLQRYKLAIKYATLPHPEADFVSFLITNLHSHYNQARYY